MYPEAVAARHAQSPVYGVDRIKAAIMLVHGAKDERVPIKHMHEPVDRMAAVGKKPEQIVVEKKEAHGFRDIDNNVNLYTKMLAFFDRRSEEHTSELQSLMRISYAVLCLKQKKS